MAASGLPVAFPVPAMMYGFIDRVTSANQLKEALDAGSQRVRMIANRVAQASLANQDGFALPAPASGQAPGAPAAGADIEADMTALADEQLRYEATSKLLSKAYAQVRAAMQSN